MKLSWNMTASIFIILLALLGLIAWFSLPVSASREVEHSGIRLFFATFADSPLGLVALFVVISTYIFIIIITVIRLVDLDLRHFARNNNALTPVLYVLGLSKSNTFNDTIRLGAGLSVANLVGLVLFSMLVQHHMRDGFGVMLFLATLPLTGLSLSCLPAVQLWLNPGLRNMEMKMYLEICNGPLIGARPQIDPPAVTGNTQMRPGGSNFPGLFWIGQGESNDLVLFHDRSIMDKHVCIFFPGYQPVLRAYGPIIINDRHIEHPGDYPLKAKMFFQIGSTLLQFDVKDNKSG